jgi:stage V sporulation protein G
MEITEIRVFQKEGQDKKLKAYATITFDNSFVVRNIKVIQGSNGLFIAMPSRKMKRLCQKCHFKNEVGSKFCNHCGTPIKSENHDAEHPDAKTEHRDIAHPITQQFREYLQTKILEAYEKEIVAGGGLGASAEEVSSEVK